jgi:hypothetical protein
MTNVLLTFDDLSAGDIVGSQYVAQGVTISTTNPHNPPMIFDTSHPTGGDYDLATSNLGNVLIASEDGDSSDPDDNAGYSTFVFDFEDPSEVINFNVLDTEEGGYVRLFDEHGSLIAELPLTVTADGGQAVMPVGYTGVSKMEITLCGSGAIDNICYTRPEPALDGIVEGTAGDDLIDIAYTGDPEGDMIDANDAILPGEAPQDDIVYAGAGDDVVISGEGSDEVFGGTGDDTIIGGAEGDKLYGEDGRDTFIINSSADGAGDHIFGGEGGDDHDTLDLTGSGPLNINYTSADKENGTVDFLDAPGGNVTGSLTFHDIEKIVPCFTPGTAIATPRGEILVEDLIVGDKIITRDNGIQEIRWIGAKRMDARVFANNPHLQPVLVQKGSLGFGLPERDMLVSPNHRMLVNNDRVALYFEENEVLVAAKHLVNPTEGVQPIHSMGTTYIHFMFDRHEVVLANGAWTESFQPGDYSLNGIGNAQRTEIFELFPELSGSEGREAYASARLTLKKHEAKILFK